jgi:hypothetical protein
LKAAQESLFIQRLSMQTSTAIDLPIEVGTWEAVIPLPSIDVKATPFEFELLESALRPFVEDTTERLQCPPDFIAAPVMVAVGSLIGRKVQIAPKANDDWRVVPNIWGGIVGTPGTLKSPALSEVLRPLTELELEATQSFDSISDEYSMQMTAWDAKKKVAQSEMIKMAKAGGDVASLAEELHMSQPSEPVCMRYIANDPTVEKLGELLNENPNGILLMRDELTGFLRSMDKPGRESDRAFYLEAWNGNNPFTYDRIKRGTVRIESACVSCVGGIQPGPLMKYQQDALTGGKGDDGLLQRFQLLVWPDSCRIYTNVDRVPDAAAYDSYRSLCKWLSSLEGESMVRFTPSAQCVFDDWRVLLENRLRNDDLSPAMESHLAKYRSLIPSLALINHLSNGEVSDVPEESLLRAIAWGVYLESHAQRIYSAQIQQDIQAAHQLLAKIEKGQVAGEFSLREVYRHGWKGLAATAAVRAAANVLIDHNVLAEYIIETSGRSKTTYAINPEVLHEPA